MGKDGKLRKAGARSDKAFGGVCPCGEIAYSEMGKMEQVVEGLEQVPIGHEQRSTMRRSTLQRISVGC